MKEPGTRPVPADLDRAALDAYQARGMQDLLMRILPSHRFYTQKFTEANIDVGRLVFPGDLQLLPFTTKAELLAAQEKHPPHGELLTYPLDRYNRMHQTSGTSGKPLRWYDTPESWELLLECWREKFRIAGITSRDRLFFPFSFGPFLGFWTAFEAGIRHGCFTLPGGGMSSPARLRYLLQNEVSVVFCTPTYALRLLEVAEEEGISLVHSPVRMLIVAGEPGGSIPATRARIAQGWGARVFDHNGMTETGPLGFECVEAPGGLHLLESACIPEVIDPNTGHPVPTGGEGELVITSFRRIASPLIRYRTGDLVRVDPHPCRCGRALVRLEGGIRGRVDDMIFVRGNNVHPSSIQTILHGIQGVSEYLIEVDQRGALTELRIKIEPAEGAAGITLLELVHHALRRALPFRVEVELCEPGTLPRAEMKARRVVRKT
ncbi:MAG: AMP-binding protein [Gemmataceae bacterium]